MYHAPIDRRHWPLFPKSHRFLGVPTGEKVGVSPIVRQMSPPRNQDKRQTAKLRGGTVVALSEGGRAGDLSPVPCRHLSQNAYREFVNAGLAIAPRSTVASALPP